MSDLIERKSIRNMYSCLDPNDRVLVGQVLIDIDAIPSADVPTTMTEVIGAIREAEYRGYMKGVLVGGEERSKGEWTDTLAELHERFDALEKEIRKASAEMSAIIREYVDRPKGEWAEREVLEDTVINEWQSARCSECGKYHTTPYMYYFDNFNFCPNCGAKMDGERKETDHE